MSLPLVLLLCFFCRRFSLTCFLYWLYYCQNWNECLPSRTAPLLFMLLSWEGTFELFCCCLVPMQTLIYPIRSGRYLSSRFEKDRYFKRYCLVVNFCFVFLQYNEIPAALTKSDHILKVLHPRVIKRDSWLLCSYLPTTMCTDWGETKQTKTHRESATVLYKVPYAVVMWIKPGLNASNMKSAYICYVHRVPYASVQQNIVFFNWNV